MGKKEKSALNELDDDEALHEKLTKKWSSKKEN